jgi:hypothetical protein
MNFNDNDIAEEQVNVRGHGADRRLEISTVIHNMGLHFQLYKYSPIFRFKERKKKNCMLFCNVSNDLDFCLPFSVDINTNKALNVI